MTYEQEFSLSNQKREARLHSKRATHKIYVYRIHQAGETHYTYSGDGYNGQKVAAFLRGEEVAVK